MFGRRSMWLWSRSPSADRIPSYLARHPRNEDADRQIEITQPTIPTPKAGVKPWMGKRNPVKLVSAVVKRKSAVVTGKLFEANIPPQRSVHFRLRQG